MNKRRMLAMLLTLAMVIGMVSVNAFAASETCKHYYGGNSNWVVTK